MDSVRLGVGARPGPFPATCLSNPPLLERIARGPDLKRREDHRRGVGRPPVRTRWGSFFQSGAGREWNGRYRDDVRRFWRGDGGMLGLFASRICGSADIYTKSGKGPEGSINFVTCHDGFHSKRPGELSLQAQ